MMMIMFSFQDMTHNFQMLTQGVESQWGCNTSLLLSLLAVSCISKKVPEPAANKEEMEGKKQTKQVDFVFVLTCGSSF